MNFKSVFGLGMVAFSLQGQAAYENVLSCDGAHVDVDTNERRKLQLVITDPKALTFLNDFRYVRPGSSPSGLYTLPFGAKEIVVPGSVFSKIDFGAAYGPKQAINESAQGVFSPSQFDYFMDPARGNASVYHYGYISEKTTVGRVNTVYRKGNELHVQYAQIVPKGCSVEPIFSTSCGGEGGGYCPRRTCYAEEKTEFDVILDYVFHDCE